MLLLGLSVSMWGQENIVVTGIVTDTNKEPMIGVNVVIADMPGLGAITDINGKFLIKMPPYHKLVFTYIGYDQSRGAGERTTDGKCGDERIRSTFDRRGSDYRYGSTEKDSSNRCCD